MLKNHWNTLLICLFRQTTKQPLSNFAPEKSENTSNFEGWALALLAIKKESVLKMVAEKGRVHISNADFPQRCLFNPFPANVTIMETPGSWFLLAKSVKNTCGRVTF